MGRPPHFMIIGAMKCATTTIHVQLSQQSGIFMTDPKEPNFFSDPDRYSRGYDWYLSLYSLSEIGDLCGESSTHYTKLPTYPDTVERICTYLGGEDTRFIYVIRHPIDRLISHYIHEWSQNIIRDDINEAIYSHDELVQYSCYAKQIFPYLETFGRKNILISFYENIIKNPQLELERICRFIGYSGSPVWDECIGAQNISSERMRKSRLRTFLTETPGLKQLRQRFVPQVIRDQVKQFWTMKSRPELSVQSRDHLRKIFDEDLSLLCQWLELDLTCDNFKSTAWDSLSTRRISSISGK